MTKKSKARSNFFESFPGLVALLDEKGFILQVNKSWVEQGLALGLFFRPDTIGYNYFDLCKRAAAEGDKFSAKVMESLGSLMKGKIDHFSCLYTLKDEKQGDTYLFTIFQISSRPKLWAVVHQLLPCQRMTVADFKGPRAVEARSPLTESAKMYELITGKVLPIFELLKPYLPQKLTDLLAKVEQDLKVALLTEAKKYHPLSGLSSREAQVALLVKEGKSSEEIAQILGLSKSAVDFYRKSLRKKFGLKGRKQRLSTFLQSIDGPTKM